MSRNRFLPALLCTCIAVGIPFALPAAAVDGTAALVLQPQQTEVETGQTVTLSVTVEQTDMPLAGAKLTLTFADGYQFDSAQAGSGIEASEFSYSYLGDRMVLLYLDNGAGASPAPAGAELAQVSVKALKESGDPPLLCTKSEAVGAQGEEVFQLDAAVTVGAVTVTGATVTEPAPAPHYAEEGQQKQEIDPASIPPAAEPDPQDPAEAAAGEADTPPAQPSPDGSSGQPQPTSQPDAAGTQPAGSGADGGTAGSTSSDAGSDTAGSENAAPQPLEAAAQEQEPAQDTAREARQRQKLVKQATGAVLIGLVLLGTVFLVWKGKKKK